jgi:hypothetical protein
MSNSDDQKKGKLGGAPQLSDMILGSLKPRVGKETSKWVAGLTEDAMQAAEAAAQSPNVDMLTSSSQIPSKPAQVTVTAFMDYLFDCFQQYEVEWNRSAPAPELRISTERATAVVETLRPKLRAPETRQVFRGRISTQYWTLVLIGVGDTMDGWILPIDQLITFTGDHDAFKQFLNMRGQSVGNDIVWNIDGINVSCDKIRSFGKQLFAALIHVAKLDTNEGLVFSLKPKQDAAKAAAEKSGEVNYSFDDHNPDFEGYSLNYEASKPAAPAAPAAPPAPPAPAAEPTAKSIRSKTMKQESTGTETAPVKARSAQPTATPQPAPVTVPAGDGPKLEAFLDLLPKAFNAELDRLSAEGQAAFARQDMEAVQKTFDRTNKLKALRDDVDKQVETWKAMLKQAMN